MAVCSSASGEHYWGEQGLLSGQRRTRATGSAAGKYVPTPTGDVDSVTAAALRFRDGALVTLATACTLDWQQQADLKGPRTGCGCRSAKTT